MAYAKIVHEWSDGQVTAMEVGGDLESREDCVESVLRIWHDCVEGEPA